MYPKLLSRILSAAFISVSIASFASANIGGQDSGGGDLCEERFKSIARDLATWINAGGAQGLQLAHGGGNITAGAYASAMLTQLSHFQISCVSPGDANYPVVVGGEAKECRSFRDSSGMDQVICDRAKFYSGLQAPENDPNQYKIAHHEFATLAGLEVPNQGDSTYWLSDQLTGFLDKQTVLKLAVKPSAANEARVGTVLLTNHPYSNDAISPDRKHFAYVNSTGFTVLNLMTYEEILSVKTVANMVRYSFDGKLLCSGKGFFFGDLTCFDAVSGKLKFAISDIGYQFYSQDGSKVVTLTQKDVVVHSMKDGSLIKRIAIPANILGYLPGARSQLSPDGKQFAFPSLDSKKRPVTEMLDLSSGRITFAVLGAYGAYDSTGQKIATIVSDGDNSGIAIYSPTTGKKIDLIPETKPEGDIPEYLPNGNLMVKRMVVNDCDAQVYDKHDQPIYPLTCTNGTLRSNTDPGSTIYLGFLNMFHAVAVSNLNTGLLYGVINTPDIIEEAFVLSASRALVVTTTGIPRESTMTLRILALPGAE